MPEAPMTDAQKQVHAELQRLLGEDTPWLAAAVLVTYKAEGAGPRDINIANAIGMRGTTIESALGIVQMIQRLRGLADELQAVVDGMRPLPNVPEAPR